MDNTEITPLKSSNFLKSEFKKNKFLFTTNEPLKLATAECGRCDALYTVYRALWALWWVATFLWDVIKVKNKAEFWLYITNWTYVSLSVSSVLQLVVVVHRLVLLNRRQAAADVSTPVLYQINWAVYSMTQTLPVIVTPLYLANVIDGGDVHHFTLAYVLVDLFITGIPIRILHVWLPQLFAIAYVIMTLIYWAVTDHVVYDVLDHEAPGATAGFVLAGVFILIPICQLLLFVLYWIRKLIYSHCACACAVQNCCKPKPQDELYVMA